MAKGLSPSDLNRLARIGAAARLAELEQEISALRRAFPGLRPSASDTPAAPAPQPAAKVIAAASRRGRRKPMSAAERKAVSERMKKYWAERRKKRD